MADRDTVKLLRECDAGAKMGIDSIDDMLKYVLDDKLRMVLMKSKSDHEKLEEELETVLSRYHDQGKEPGIMAKGMSWIKTNVKLVLDESDNTIAELVTDGCNMGIKTLNKYINECSEADKEADCIARKLIKIEENLAQEVKEYL